MVRAGGNHRVAATIIPRATSFDQVIRLKVPRVAYDALAGSLGDDGHVRLTYDGEVLEIMSPSPIHEIISRVVAEIVSSIKLEWKINITDLGSTRFKPIGGVEFEADGAWYIDMKTKVRDRMNIDLTVDAPPDILLETDITTKSSDKFNIFGNMGVPEVWLYDLSGFSARTLENGKYTPISVSRVIAGLPIPELAKRINDEAGRSESDSLAFLESWHQWLREHKNLHDDAI
jgi:Uma2 family endonuclease